MLEANMTLHAKRGVSCTPFVLPVVQYLHSAAHIEVQQCGYTEEYG